MSEKEPEALRVPLLDLALVSEEKKKERPRKKPQEAGNKNNDGDNRVPQEKNKTMSLEAQIAQQKQENEALKKQLADLVAATAAQQPAQPQVNPMLAALMAQQMGLPGVNPMAAAMGMPQANPFEMMAQQQKIQEVGFLAQARVKALGPAAPDSLKHAVMANALGVSVDYKPTPSGWETASSAFGVGIGIAGGVLAALGIAAATKLAVDALFGGGTTDPSAPTTTG